MCIYIYKYVCVCVSIYFPIVSPMFRTYFPLFSHRFSQICWAQIPEEELESLRGRVQRSPEVVKARRLGDGAGWLGDF